jgi:formylglycine-generating enzyme required for sulfatase activity
VTDPVGPLTGWERVLRGGGWDYYAVGARAADRDVDGPDYRYGNGGFRLARSLP